jgi:hypothetical protein
VVGQGTGVDSRACIMSVKSYVSQVLYSHEMTLIPVMYDILYILNCASVINRCRSYCGLKL